jgi:23S rRNA pseudouridine2605 synthase
MRTPALAEATGEDASGIRLQKVLAAAGVGSRRACEALIAEGRVSVDGRVVRRQGVRVDPATALITVDGERITTAESGRVYLALNKPVGVISTMKDEQGRESVVDYVPPRYRQPGKRLFNVGRLDADTEGLLLLTNDGELAHRLAHPSYEVPKTYLAEVRGPMGRDVGRRLRDGVELDDGVATADSFRVVGSSEPRLLVEIVLHEGRKHVVRRMLDAVGHPVLRLVRTKVGPVSLGELRPGRTRELTRAEVSALLSAVGM